MEEKKLVDEEIVRDLKFCVEQEDCVRCKYDDCVDCRAFLMEEALAFIHRLQDEKKELQESADLFNDFNEKLTGIIEGQKVEIERLTKENKQLEEEIDLEVDLQTQRKRQIIAESQEFVDELANKNAELQKQVDELMRKIESYQHSFEYIQGYEDGENHAKKTVATWIPASTKPGVHAGMKCSLCGARIKYSEFYNGNHNFCHKCGAKMEVSNK